MPQTNAQADWWRRVAMLPWLAFFAAGLVPETVFVLLRETGRVPTQRALVNSPLALTFALAVYLAFFAYRRCVECGMSGHHARKRALYVGIVGLAAFLGTPQSGSSVHTVSLVGALFSFRAVADPSVRATLLIAGLTKLGLWWYLFILVLRYHALGDDAAFAPKALCNSDE